MVGFFCGQPWFCSVRGWSGCVVQLPTMLLLYFIHPSHHYHYTNRDPGPPPAAPTASYQSVSCPAVATGSFHRSVGVRCVGSEEQVNRCLVSWFWVLHRGHSGDGQFCGSIL